MISTLKHDSAGFLIGELLDSSKSLLETQTTGIGIWRGIRTDVSAIARAMRASTGSNAQPDMSHRSSVAAQPAGRTSVAAMNARERGANGRFTVAVPVGRTAAKTIAAEVGAAVVAERKRGERGRFAVNGNKPASEGGTGGAAFLSDKIGKVADAVKNIATGTENLDPSITAIHEVKTVLEPFGRGAFALFGRNPERKKERWYNRILKAITRRNETSGAAGAGESSGEGLLSGMGAAAGRLLLPLIPYVVTAIGAILAVAGGALFGTAVGGKIYDWLDRSGIATKIFDTFDNASQWFRDKFNQVSQKVEQVKTDYLTGKNEGFKGSGGSNNSHRMMEDGNVGSLGPVTSIAQGVGRLVGGVQRGRAYMAGAGGRNVAENRALQTGSEYKAGNIGGLDDAQTRALVASTALTESGGGKLGVVNPAGYMGRYQAGAGWLADAGHIKGGSEAVKTAMAKDGFKSEYKWGESGGMSKFLKDDANWNGGMNYKSYLASADVQDKAFKTNSDTAYNSLMKKGLINSSTPPEQVAGLLKARHISGLGGAEAVALGGNSKADANGTTARKYYEDVAKDKNGFMGVYNKTATTALPSVAAAAVPSSIPEKIGAAPEVAMPTPEPRGKDRSAAHVPSVPVGQNLSDRNIAHIVTGGIGASGGW